MSFAWKPENPYLWVHLVAPLERGCALQGVNSETHEVFGSSSVRGTTGGIVMVEQSIGGGAVGYLPRHQLIFIEGRLAALCARDASATGLVKAG